MVNEDIYVWFRFIPWIVTILISPDILPSPWSVLFLGVCPDVQLSSMMNRESVSPRIPVSSKSRLTICGWHYTCCLFCHNLRLFCSVRCIDKAALAVSDRLCWLDIFVLMECWYDNFIHALYAAKTPVVSVCELCWKCINIFNFQNLVNIFSAKYLYH